MSGPFFLYIHIANEKLTPMGMRWEALHIDTKYPNQTTTSIITIAAGIGEAIVSKLGLDVAELHLAVVTVTMHL